MTDPHTFSVCSVNLVGSAVLLPHGDFLKFTCDVVCSTTIHVPVRVHLVGGGKSNNTLSRIDLLTLKALPTVHYLFSILLTQLAIRDIEEAYIQPIKRIDMSLEGVE